MSFEVPRTRPYCLFLSNRYNLVQMSVCALSLSKLAAQIRSRQLHTVPGKG
jgi:hypothetical protein